MIFFGCILLFSFTVTSETISVDDSGGAEYTSIQDAINAANESDTIEVAAGTYNENIVINKSLNVIGSGKQNTFLIGSSATQNTVKIIADTVYLSGFSIDNSQGMSMQYHAIFIQSVQTCTISNNLVKNGENGIYVISSEMIEIFENTIENNNQKGIRLSTSNNNVIRDNIIQNNGDGIYTTSSDANDIYENIILGNGIGIYIAIGSNDNIIYTNDFDDNTGGNAVDTGSNSWSKSNQGNYWDDYQDYDSDEDGVGDNPYIIDQNSQDDYPLGDFLTMNQEPVAIIDSISPNPAISGESVSFHGHGTDDGSIIEWEWKSSKNGVFGTSADCSTSSLSVGSHTISFRVKDDSLQWSSYDTATLSIQTESNPSTNERPVAIISLIEPLETTFGEEITFHGYGTDTDGTITGYQWRSSIDGDLSSQSSFTKTTLSIGPHTIYFKVKDNNDSWSIEDEMTLNIQSIESDNEKPVPDFTITSQTQWTMSHYYLSL
jgi:parallel beta-helix repeat protein